jgi:hypothetical protein
MVSDAAGCLILFRSTLQCEIPRLHFMHDCLALPAKRLNEKLLDSLKPILEAPGTAVILPSHIVKTSLAPLNVINYEHGYKLQDLDSMDGDATIVYTKSVYEAARLMSEYLQDEDSHPLWITECMGKQTRYVHRTIAACRRRLACSHPTVNSSAETL